MIDVARSCTYTCLRRPTDNIMNKSNCSRTKSTHIQYIETQCRIRITNTITLCESVLGCRHYSFDNVIFSLIIILVSWFLCLSIPSFSLIGCQRFRIKSMIVNDGDPSLDFFFLVIFLFDTINVNICIYLSHVECAKKRWPSSPFISDRVMLVHTICVCIVTDTLCHKRNVFTYTQCKIDVYMYVL
jgi:hypothetical protein